MNYPYSITRGAFSYFGLIAILAGPFGIASAQTGKFDNATTAECLADQTCQETILQRIETRMGTLEYKAGYPTEATVEALYVRKREQGALA
jgi:hypothetical protein